MAPPAGLTLDSTLKHGMKLRRSMVKKAGFLKRYEAKALDDSMGDEAASLLSFVLPDVQIGPFELGNASVVVENGKAETRLLERRPNTATRMKTGRGQSDGFIGYGLLKHFVVTLDARSGHVHLDIPEQDLESQPN